MTKPTDEQISKLPAWARERIKNLQRERDEAVKALNKWADTQTPSPFRAEEMLCTGEEQGPSAKTRYIQARALLVVHGNIELRVSLPMGASGQGITLQWGGVQRNGIEMAMIPESFQRVRIIEQSEMCQ